MGKLLRDTLAETIARILGSGECQRECFNLSSVTALANTLADALVDNLVMSRLGFLRFFLVLASLSSSSVAAVVEFVGCMGSVLLLPVYVCVVVVSSTSRV